jgi:hypothetical protein
MKECIDMVVTSTAMVDLETNILFEWEYTELAIIPIVVRISDYVEVSWSTQCHDGLQIIQKHCDVLVDVSINSQLLDSIFAEPSGVIQSQDTVTVRASPHVEHMHFFNK